MVTNINRYIAVCKSPDCSKGSINQMI